jgi:electron transport complex protein RnfB
LTGLPYAPLNPANGEHKPRVLAVIDEAACIGCTICIQKCPVDAIAGAAKLMHTVIAGECTGCELCVAPCPVDCIALVPMPAWHPALATGQAAADNARRRHRARLARLQRLAERRAEDRATRVARCRWARPSTSSARSPPRRRARGRGVKHPGRHESAKRRQIFERFRAANPNPRGRARTPDPVRAARRL